MICVAIARQNHLDDVEQERFAVRLGQLVPHPTVGVTKGTASDPRSRFRAWRRPHTDVTFVDAYPKIFVSRGVVVPPCGGDTI
jgi:taurine dioxygenase